MSPNGNLVHDMTAENNVPRRFIADGMVGRLARWLRLIGNDVEYPESCSDRELTRRAMAEGRVLLTNDVELYRHAISKNVDCFLVRGTTEAERLAKVADRYGLALEIDADKSRCTSCNALIRSLKKQDAAGRVMDSTFMAFDRFWECTNPDCGKVYWQGGHWENIEQHLNQAKRILSRGAGS